MIFFFVRVVAVKSLYTLRQLGETPITLSTRSEIPLGKLR